MISYCIPVFRPWFAKRLISDLIRKTSTAYEILLWLNNVKDAELDAFLADVRAAGHPVRVVGRTPENIGMQAFANLFREARYDLITQIDDDVICVTPRIAEICAETFARFPKVKQLVADCWRDEFTSGARPARSSYRTFEATCGLYDGPIDGWFSVYHRSILPVLIRSVPGYSIKIRGKRRFPWVHLRLCSPSRYFCMGATVQSRLARRGELGLLCTRFKVFHVTETHYVSYFNVIDFEIEKYRRVGRDDMVKHYEKRRSTVAPREVLEAHVKQIEKELATPIPSNSEGVFLCSP